MKGCGVDVLEYRFCDGFGNSKCGRESGLSGPLRKVYVFDGDGGVGGGDVGRDLIAKVGV